MIKQFLVTETKEKKAALKTGFLSLFANMHWVNLLASIGTVTPSAISNDVVPKAFKI